MSGVIIVTGAAGVLGEALVKRLVADGKVVVGVDYAEGEDLGQAAFIGRCDLTDAATARATYGRIADEFGPIAGLANIAGGFAWEKLAEGGVDTWERMFALNVKTTHNSCQAALPLMGGDDPAIVNVGALGALTADAGMGAYAASKAGVMRLTEALAAECKDGGPRVNAVLPSIIDTPQNREDMPGEDFSRWVSPAALAEVIAFLLSDKAWAMTGALVPVKGRV